eukprot:CAMPEP_0174255464 /NCGR_PEP_ID=MMETSP0439-20130205/4799_1 /TAXON_ID=0 /ORGANISM="Stereomyxa ramosa, Strain Chinc5" /LENGTH=1001 /DNA_ID=CAMNT_0015337669 /DNA_START=192 /DNA_END=3194 /DNA_ORIENTATION=-
MYRSYSYYPTYSFYTFSSLRFPSDKKKTLPLESISVGATIDDFSACVTLQHHFSNSNSQPLEAVYEFRLDNSFCINALKIVVGDKIINAVIKEQEEAKDIYDDSIASGDGAYLLEQSEKDPDLFSLSIGNLPPGIDVITQVCYSQNLKMENGFLKWGLLQSATNTSKSAIEGDSIKAEHISQSSSYGNYYRNPYHYSGIPPYIPSYYYHSPYFPLHSSITSSTEYKTEDHPLPSVKVEVHVKMSENIHSIFCEEGRFETIFLNPKELKIKGRIKKKYKMDTPPLQDLSLQISTQNFHPKLLFYPDQKFDNYIAVVSCTPEMSPKLNTSVEFLLDISTKPLYSVQIIFNMLEVFLRSLPESVKFNIIFYGKQKLDCLYSSSSDATDDSISEATTFIKERTKTCTTTKKSVTLTEALQSTVNSNLPANYSRQIFIFDEDPTAYKSATEALRPHSSCVRFFMFSCNTSDTPTVEIERIGEFEKVKEADLEEAVIRKLESTLNPSIVNMDIDWGNLQAQSAPFILPPVFKGQRLLAYALVDSSDLTSGEIVITGDGNEDLEVHLSYDESNLVTDNSSHLKYLYAKALITDLEQGTSAFHLQKVDKKDKKGKKRKESGYLQKKVTEDKIKERIMEVSVNYQVKSKYTSFVGVEHRTEAVEGTMVKQTMGVQVEKEEKKVEETPTVTTSMTLHNQQYMYHLHSYPPISQPYSSLTPPGGYPSSSTYSGIPASSSAYSGAYSSPSPSPYSTLPSVGQTPTSGYPPSISQPHQSSASQSNKTPLPLSTPSSSSPYSSLPSVGQTPTSGYPPSISQPPTQPGGYLSSNAYSSASSSPYSPLPSVCRTSSTGYPPLTHAHHSNYSSSHVSVLSSNSLYDNPYYGYGLYHPYPVYPSVTSVTHIKEAPKKKKEAKKLVPVQLRSIILKQRVDGFWEEISNLGKFVGLDEAQTLFSSFGSSHKPVPFEVFFAVLICVVLEDFYPQDYRFTLIQKKAKAAVLESVGADVRKAVW